MMKDYEQEIKVRNKSRLTPGILAWVGSEVVKGAI